MVVPSLLIGGWDFRRPPHATGGATSMRLASIGPKSHASQPDLSWRSAMFKLSGLGARSKYISPDLADRLRAAAEPVQGPVALRDTPQIG